LDSILPTYKRNDQCKGNSQVWMISAAVAPPMLQI
jgi:hypothetical protein